MNNQLVEIMRFSVGSQHFGILRDKVQSVQHANRVRLLSAENEPFEAVLRTSEGELPVLRLADFMGDASAMALADQRLMILRSAWGLWCLLVDSVTQTEEVAASKIKPLPMIARNGLAADVYTDGEDVLLMLSPDNIHPNALVSAEVEEVTKPPIDWIDTKPADKSNLVLFQMPGTGDSGATYAVGLTPKQINEVLRSATLKPVPTGPDYLAGVMTWRGQLVPVMNLGKRLGLTSGEHGEPAKTDRIVIAHGIEPDKLIAFYADPSVDILRLPAPHRPIIEVDKIDQSLMHGAAEYAGQTVIIPHVSNLAAVS